MDRDARSLPEAAQEELRRRAVKLVDEGRTQTEVARLLGVTRQAIGNWLRARRRGGDRALAARRRGRRGGHTKLSDAQQQKIARLIVGHNPDQLKLPGFLWTRALVRDLIAREFAIELGEDTVGRYLRAWGFSPQKPMGLSRDTSSRSVTVRQENGATLTFDSDGPWRFTTPGQVDATLRRKPDGTYALIRRHREKFAFSADGRLIAAQDLNGETITLSYDESLRLTTATDPAGRTLTVAYGANGRIASVTNPGARRVSYAYDGGGNLISVIDAAGEATAFTYDLGHRLLTMRDANGGVVSNSYDAQGRVLEQKDPLQRVTKFDYSAAQTKVTSPKGVITLHRSQSEQSARRAHEGVGHCGCRNLDILL